jgi:hypothetical protein
MLIILPYYESFLDHFETQLTWDQNFKRRSGTSAIRRPSSYAKKTVKRSRLVNIGLACE